MDAHLLAKPSFEGALIDPDPPSQGGNGRWTFGITLPRAGIQTAGCQQGGDGQYRPFPLQFLCIQMIGTVIFTRQSKHVRVNGQIHINEGFFIVASLELHH